MDALQRRPLGTFAFVFYVSSCFIYAIGGGVWLTLPLFALFVILLFRGRRIPFRRALTLISAGILAASLFSVFFVDVRLARIEELAGQERDIVGTVTEVRYASSWEGCYTVDADEMKVLLYSDECELKRGDVISCTVVYEKLDPSGDTREYLLSDGIVLTAESVGEVNITGRGSGPEILRGELRDMLSETLKSAMPEKAGGFASALLLGDRSGLDGSITRDFRALGISHIIAISGSHLSVLFYGASRLIPERRRRLRILAICPSVVLYMLLTGLSASVVRAGIMMIVASLGYAVNKRSDSFTSLSVSAVIICLFSPMAPFDAGLQLSFGAVTGLIISSEIFRNTVAGRKGFAASLFRKIIPSITVPAVILPLMWIRFGEVSLISPVANILFVPAVSLFVPVLAVLLILSPFKVIFVSLSSAVGTLISVILCIINRAASAADFVLPLGGSVSFAAMLMFTVALFAALLASGKRRSTFACTSVIFLGATLISAQISVCIYNSGLTVCYAAANKDEAICAMSDGNSILVDMGQYPSALRSAAETGISFGSGRFDALVLTHLHESHRLTLAETASGYYLKSLWIPEVCDGNSADIARSLEREAEKLGIEVYMYTPGETLRFGECELVAPVTCDQVNSAHGSVSFSVKCGDDTLIYSPDRSADGEVNISAVHGVNLNGTAFVPSGNIDLISARGAASAELLPNDTVVTKRAVIRFSGSSSPAVYPQA